MRHRESLALAAVGLAGLAWCGTARPAEDAGDRSAAETAAIVAPRVEALRGLTFAREVPVAVVDEDAAVEHLLARIESFQPRERLDLTERAYELLGLLPPDFDLLGSVADWVRGGVAGFYDPESEKFFVVEHVSDVTGPLIIAHELTHALEDQHLDLDARMRAVIDDDDRMLAQAALREGSAILVMAAFAAGTTPQEFGLDDAEWGGASEVDVAETDPLARLPSAIRRQLLAPYVFGPRFLVRGAQDADPARGYPIEDARRAWADPPRSTEQILHPDKYWTEAERDDPRAVSFAGAAAALGDGFDLAIEGTLGELTLGALVGAPTPGDAGSPAAGDWSNAASRGWDGDRWELWVRGDSAVVLLGTLWDSPRDAREFAEALPRRAGLRRLVRGDAVALVAGDAGPATRRVLRRMLDRLGSEPAPGVALVPVR